MTPPWPKGDPACRPRPRLITTRIACSAASRAAKKATGCEGVTLVQANEKAGAQTVFHFHIHVLPRWEGDGMELAWPVKNPPREALGEMAAKLREALAGEG